MLEFFTAQMMQTIMPMNARSRNPIREGFSDSYFHHSPCLSNSDDFFFDLVVNVVYCILNFNRLLQRGGNAAVVLEFA